MYNLNKLMCALPLGGPVLINRIPDDWPKRFVSYAPLVIPGGLS